MRQPTNTFLVTGATDGIGLETAFQLASMGHRVLAHGRTLAKAEAAVEAVRTRLPTAELTPVWGDLSSQQAVRALAAQVKAAAPVLDGLINNAGVFMDERVTSEDGLELSFAINHLAPFLLTHLLLEPLKAAPQGRVVNVSSIAHGRGRVDLADLDFKHGFTGYGAYGATKLMNIYFTHELARRLRGTKVTVAALHPGVITTKLLQKGFNMAGASVAEGAKTSVYCATAPALERVTGQYFADGRESHVAPHAVDPKLEAALYEASCRLCDIAPLPVR